MEPPSNIIIQQNDIFYLRRWPCPDAPFAFCDGARQCLSSCLRPQGVELLWPSSEDQQSRTIPAVHNSLLENEKAGGEYEILSAKKIVLHIEINLAKYATA